MRANIYLAGCFGAALVACGSTVYSNMLIKESIELSVDKALIESSKHLVVAFEQSKPKTHQERLMKSQRVFEHTVYLADKYYDGDLMAEPLVRYSDNAYSDIMANVYNSMFYSKLAGMDRSDLSVKTYTQINNEKIFTDDISKVTGAVIQGKYNIDLATGSIFTDVIASGGINSTYLYMVNDFVPHPQCAEGGIPVVVFGELYPDGSKPYGATTSPEASGWRVGFKDIDPLSDTALQNRIMLQTACRIVDNKVETDTIESAVSE